MRGKLTVLLALLCLSLGLRAQRTALDLRLGGGHNYAYGLYGTAAVLLERHPSSGISYHVGATGCSAGEWAAAAGVGIAVPCGNIEVRIDYRALWRRFAQWNIDELSGGALVGLQWRGWRLMLGLADRMVAPAGVDWLGESMDWVAEPLNLMYELCYSFALGNGPWRGEVRLADYDDFVTDRAYQPIVSLRCARRLADRGEVYLRCLLHPTGMLSLSANYYETAIIGGFTFNIQK